MSCLIGADQDYDAVVEDLAVKHRAKAAVRTLIAAGMSATPAVRRGLGHPNPRVREECCNVLDHFLDEAAVGELIANLEDADAGVRSRALHALACDRCKEGACRPAENEIIPIAIRLLKSDPDRFVRKSAVEMLGPASVRNEGVRAALIEARDKDPDPLVRKVASWHTPGGRIYEGLPSRSGRHRNRTRADVARAGS
jgi:HEAT repeat protein